METVTKDRFQLIIWESWNVINEELDRYISKAAEGEKHVTMLVAHATNMKNIKSVNIEDTNTYATDPSIKLKLLHNVRKEIAAEKCKISNTLNELDGIYQHIMKQCQKVFDLFRNSLGDSITLDELCEGSVMSFSIALKIEAFNKFKTRFNDSHMSRMYLIDFYDVGGDLMKMGEIWDTCKLSAAQEDLCEINKYLLDKRSGNCCRGSV